MHTSVKASGTVDYTGRERRLSNQRQARQEPRSPANSGRENQSGTVELAIHHALRTSERATQQNVKSG